jgi:hypothetical protein
MADNIDPDFLRERARFYREFADQETDPQKAALFRELTDAFDREADVRERGRPNTAPKW